MKSYIFSNECTPPLTCLHVCRLVFLCYCHDDWRFHFLTWARCAFELRYWKNNFYATASLVFEIGLQNWQYTYLMDWLARWSNPKMRRWLLDMFGTIFILYIFRADSWFFHIEWSDIRKQQTLSFHTDCLQKSHNQSNKSWTVSAWDYSAVSWC